ncbi:MAG: bifunctional glutamate N-acetyltransferase/amino-acid acetyltransferase ArgJ [Desulfobulbaceae bacterium]|nr:bifunctional glutamate N-acetyltransferase/amino-acid acetyltransferase ArgJ [Desulfobulbaceae bacterium]
MSGVDLQVHGFLGAAVKAHVRKKDRLDLALIYSTVPAVAAGVFTTSRVKAAPVVLDMERLHNGRAQAILVNSGIANACTGAEGMRLARATSRLAAEGLGIAEELVQVASTGVIGEQLRYHPFDVAMDELVGKLSPEGLAQVALAMMTTDTVAKTAVRTGVIGGKEVKLAGLAKGSGMIMPNMATMLGFVLTDAAVAGETLAIMLKRATDRSFNVITVDGDTSTNDTVLLFANGLAGNPVVDGSDTAAMARFQEVLDDLMKDLAMQIVRDGEGATKLVTVRVKGAPGDEEALLAARTIANSPLVKTAFFGEDANWGRIIAALGRSGIDFDATQVDIAFDDVVMVRNGLGQGGEAEARATEVLKRKEFAVNIDLKGGPGVGEVYTCDFSIDYVKINADYRS